MGSPLNQVLTLEQEQLIGEEIYRQLLRSNRLINDPEAQQYIQHIGNNLVNQLKNSQQSYTFFIVDNPMINAFAAPGGYIGINAGLITASNSEHELASVIAHEIAHVHQRHIASRMNSMRSTQALSIASILAGFIAASQGLGQEASAFVFGGAALQEQQAIRYTRENEIEADRIGMQLLSAANYDPKGMIRFFKTLQRNTANTSRLYPTLSTHPLDSIRIAEAENRINNNQVTTLQPSDEEYFFIKQRIASLSSSAPLDTNFTNSKADIDQQTFKDYAIAQSLENEKKWSLSKDIYINMKASSNALPIDLGLSRSYIQLGLIEEAEATLASLYQFMPDNYAVVYYYANSLFERNKYKHVISVLTHYLRNHQDTSATLYQLLSLAYKYNQQFVAASIAQVEYLTLNGNYNAAVGIVNNLLENKTISEANKKRLQEQRNNLVERRKKIKRLG